MYRAPVIERVCVIVPLLRRHWFGLDTKVDRLDWCDKLNEALINVRQWYSDAAQPVPTRRMEI